MTLDNDETYMPGRLAEAGYYPYNWLLMQPGCRSRGILTAPLRIEGVLASAPAWNQIHIKYTQDNYSVPTGITIKSHSFNATTQAWSSADLSPSATHSALDGRIYEVLPHEILTLPPSVLPAISFYPYLPMSVVATSGWAPTLLSYSTNGDVTTQGAAAAVTTDNAWAHYTTNTLSAAQAPTITALINPRSPVVRISDYFPSWGDWYGKTAAGVYVYAWFNGAVQLNVPANYKGQYSNTTTYQVGDIVSTLPSFNQRLRRAKVVTTGVFPTNNTNWEDETAWPFTIAGEGSGIERNNTWDPTGAPERHPSIPNLVRFRIRGGAFTITVYPAWPGTPYDVTASPTLTLANGLVTSATDGTPHTPTATSVVSAKYAEIWPGVTPIAPPLMYPDTARLSPGDQSMAAQIIDSGGRIRVGAGVFSVGREWTEKPLWKEVPKAPLTRRAAGQPVWGQLGYMYGTAGGGILGATVSVVPATLVDVVNPVNYLAYNQRRSRNFFKVIAPSLPYAINMPPANVFWHLRTRRLMAASVATMQLDSFLGAGSGADTGWVEITTIAGDSFSSISVPEDVVLAPSAATMPVTEDITFDEGVTGTFPSNRTAAVSFDVLSDASVVDDVSIVEFQPDWKSGADLQNNDAVLYVIASTACPVGTPGGRRHAITHGLGPYAVQDTTSVLVNGGGYFGTDYYVTLIRPNLIMPLGIKGGSLTGPPVEYNKIFSWFGQLNGGTLYCAPTMIVGSLSAGMPLIEPPDGSLNVTVKLVRVPVSFQGYAPWESDPMTYERGHGIPAGGTVVATKVYTLKSKQWTYFMVPLWDSGAGYGYGENVQLFDRPDGQPSIYWWDSFDTTPGTPEPPGGDWVLGPGPYGGEDTVVLLHPDNQDDFGAMTLGTFTAPDEDQQYLYGIHVEYPVDLLNYGGLFPTIDMTLYMQYTAPDLPWPISVSGSGGHARVGRINPAHVGGDLGA